MRKSRIPVAMFGVALSTIIFPLSGLFLPPAKAARRDGSAYTRGDAAYVTTSQDAARLDLIICLQGVAGGSVPGGDIDKALDDAAFACGGWANRVRDLPNEPAVLDLFDAIRECGFQPGDASPDAGCGGSRAETVPAQPGLVRSAGGDGPVTKFTLIQDISVPVTVSWIDYDGIEHVAGGGDSVRTGGEWRVENGAKGYESHWYSIRSGDALLCSFALRQNAVVKLSGLAACRLPTPVRQTADSTANWWVIVRSEPNPDNADTGSANARANDALTPCRMEAFSDWSAKWQGFTPGYSVSVLGAYASKAKAEKIRREASACVPDAYVKRATYSGE